MLSHLQIPKKEKTCIFCVQISHLDHQVLLLQLPVLRKERKPFVESGNIQPQTLQCTSAQHNSWHLNSEWSQVHFHFPSTRLVWVASSAAQQPSSLTEPLYSIKSDKQQQCEAAGGSPLRCVLDIPPWSAEPNSSHYNHQPGSGAIKTSALVSDPPRPSSTTDNWIWSELCRGLAAR